MMALMKAALSVGAVTVVAGIALTSCATLNEEQCSSVDWQGLGHSDGIAGHPLSFFEKHREACVKHGLPVDQTAWQDGWNVGIRQYCTPQNGLSEGTNGRSYARSCPVEFSADFETAYQIGKRLHEARTRREAVQSDIGRLEAALDEAEERDVRRDLREELRSKRDELYYAQERERDAERAYDLYIITNNMRQS